MQTKPNTIEDLNEFVSNHIDNEHLKDLCFNMFERYKNKLIIATAGIHHHNYSGGLIDHSYGVANLCLKMMSEYSYVNLNKDLLLTAALLHDIGKIYENDTQYKMFMKHNVMSSLMIEPVLSSYNIDEKVKMALHNLILTHMQSMYSKDSKVGDVITLEGVVLRAADTVDAFIVGTAIRLNNTSPGCFYGAESLPRDLFKPNI